MASELTVAEYAARWVRTLPHVVHPRTAAYYERMLRHHVLPTLGAVPLTDLRRAQVRALLLGRRDAGLARSTVRNVLITLTGCLAAAEREELLEQNVARGAGYRLFRAPRRGWARRKAMTRDELRRFLTAAPVVAPELADFFETLAGAGLRVGEALALAPEHVDVEHSQLHIVQQWVRGVSDEPKCGSSGDVEVAATLAARLAARNGERHWLFPSDRTPHPWDVVTVQKHMRRILARTGLPERFTPHALRHTYATLLLEETGDLVYVQRQLRHASISMTADCYGASAQPSRRAALERLDVLLHRADAPPTPSPPTSDGGKLPAEDDARRPSRSRSPR